MSPGCTKMLENDEIVSEHYANGKAFTTTKPDVTKVFNRSHLHGNIIGFAIVRIDLNWPRLVDILSKGNES